MAYVLHILFEEPSIRIMKLFENGEVQRVFAKPQPKTPLEKVDKKIYELESKPTEVLDSNQTNQRLEMIIDKEAV